MRAARIGDVAARREACIRPRDERPDTTISARRGTSLQHAVDAAARGVKLAASVRKGMSDARLLEGETSRMISAFHEGAGGGSRLATSEESNLDPRSRAGKRFCATSLLLAVFRLAVQVIEALVERLTSVRVADPRARSRAGR